MYDFAADKFATICFWLFDLSGHAQCLETEDEQKKESLESIDNVLGHVEVMCKQMGYDCSSQIRRAKEQIAEHRDVRTAEALINEIKYAFVGAFKGRACYIMTPDETKLFTRPPSPLVGDRFAQSAIQLKEAAQCLALGKPEASVYHSMSGLESPLGAMARYFGFEFGVATWGTTINNIKDRLDVISRRAKAGKHKAEILQFYGEAAKEFSYFNEAWRIHVMHGRASYDHNSALSVYEHVTHFAEHLAHKLSDHGRAKCRL